MIIAMTYDNALENLKLKLTGKLLVAGDPDFEKACQIWNARLIKNPAAILQCADADDAATGVKFATKHGLPVVVRGGGHSYAGLSSGDEVLLIDFSRMKGIEIDAANRRALVEPGVHWGEFNEAALARGLAPTTGTVNSVGVAGFTLGGGSGWLTRKHGLAIDNLLSVRVVTANGELLSASESENADLFWGLRGGAGNFAIATGFEFNLHPMENEVFAGQIIYPISEARRALQVYREVMSQAPDGFCCYPAAFRIPPIEAFPEEQHGKVVLNFIHLHIGDADEGKRVVQPLRDFEHPVMDLSAKQPYSEHLKVLDAGTPPGQRWYSRGQYMNSITDEAIDAFIDHAQSIQGALTFAYFEPLGGAAGRIAPDATAFPHRDAPVSFHILAGWMDSEEDESVMQWTRDFHAAMAPFSREAVYVNLLAEDEPERIRAAYGRNFERLRDLKRKWDPDNLLNGNQNIAP